MVLKLPWAEKRMLWAFEKSIFQFFANFWVTKLKRLSGKMRQRVQNYLNQNLVIRTFLENGFGATLSSKANLLSVWKKHFSVFCKFLSDEVETIFWESEAKHSKLLKSKFDHRKLLRKWFWSYLELKNECSERLKRAFFSFLANFWVTKLKPFTGKVRQSNQNYLNQSLIIKSYLQNGFEVILSSKMNVLSLSKEHCYAKT